VGGRCKRKRGSGLTATLAAGRDEATPVSSGSNQGRRAGSISSVAARKQLGMNFFPYFFTTARCPILD
jgi:hypothetical protein